MKKTSSAKQAKIALKRETIAVLTASELTLVPGGARVGEYTYALKCTSYCNGHCV